jgi:hypothetical protein
MRVFFVLFIIQSHRQSDGTKGQQQDTQGINIIGFQLVVKKINHNMAQDENDTGVDNQADP